MSDTTRDGFRGPDYVLVAVAMGLMGAFYWAIRGTGGFGGQDGGAFAGLGWGLLWYGFSRHGARDGDRRPYSTPWTVWAITLGIAFGGMTGYGVYISWLNGRFALNHPDLVREVPAWTGYAMLFVCGFHWGGNAGCFMAWCAPARRVTWQGWLVRIACGLAGAVAAVVAVRALPQLFLPYYSEGIYSVPEYKTCQRSLRTIREIAPHVGLVLGFLAYELARGDRRAVGMILTMALGFAIPFTVGGYWQTMHESGLRIDWWKNWEMTIGLGGGLAFGLAFFLFNRPGKESRAPLGKKGSAFFNSGFPIWLPVLIVLKSAYTGWSEQHDVPMGDDAFLVLLTISVAPFVIVGAVMQIMGAVRGDVPQWLTVAAILGLQAFLILAGYAVSVPPEMRLANWVLVSLYTGYILVSIAAVAFLWARRARAA